MFPPTYFPNIYIYIYIYIYIIFLDYSSLAGSFYLGAVCGNRDRVANVNVTLRGDPGDDRNFDSWDACHLLQTNTYLLPVGCGLRRRIEAPHAITATGWHGAPIAGIGDARGDSLGYLIAGNGRRAGTSCDHEDG